MEQLVVFFIGTAAGIAITAYWYRRVIARLLVNIRNIVGDRSFDRILDLLINEPNNMLATGTEVSIEEHDQWIIAYRVDTGEFIAKAQTGPQLAERILESYSDARVVSGYSLLLRGIAKNES